MGAAPVSAADYSTGKEPMYIGAAACGKCHDGQASGHQFSIWRRTPHARAYAALSMPESKEITLLSGITQEPHKARMCLGCHATAADSEEWERMEDFHLEDGLQCEVCHGPGSEYATREIMSDRTKALANGLRIPTLDECRLCHRPKGSHDGVLKRPAFDLDAAWKRIAHPKPKGARLPEEPIWPQNFGTNHSAHQFSGVMACAKCHTGPERGFQFSKWRMSPHAQAYAVLSTPKGLEDAAQAGVTGDPQQAPQCLKCHSTGAGFATNDFTKDFDVRDGVQCEACHGPGADYAADAVMRDSTGARAKGLLKPNAATCLKCHDQSFDYASAVKKIAHPKVRLELSAAGQEPGYKNPMNLALSPDGRELWVVCEGSGTVCVLDPVTRRKIAEIAVGGQPNEVAFTPDGRKAFVSNRLDDNVSVVDVAARKAIATLEVGDEPHGLLVDQQGKYLYVLNTSMDSISVFDVATQREVKRLSASRSPWALAQSPDGQSILVTHALSRMVGDRAPSVSEVTVLDAAQAVVADRIAVPGANLLQGAAWHPSGDYALVTLLRTKNLVPMTRVNRGWTISNGLGIIWRDGTVDQVLLDQSDLCFPDPTGVRITPDGRHALVTSSSTDRVAVVDLQKLIALVKAASPREREHVLPNHLGKSVEYVVKFIPTGTTPKGLVCSADGAFAYVANMMSDSVTVIDLRRLETVASVDLGGPTEVTKRRRGERLFHNANMSFHRQFSCSTCHPDGHIDGIVYDIEDDGIGMGPIDNRTLRGINDMAPYKWTGINPSLKRQCGPRLAVFITRIQPFTPEQLDDLHYYLCSIPRPPNRYRKLGEDLTEAQRRGKAMFHRAQTNDRRPIPIEKRCSTCHAPPLYTDGRLHYVGTKFPYDRDGKFDVPQLLNIYDSAPYLHNGIAQTLEEIWTKYNPNDDHGVTNDMTKDQLNDLIEYLKTL